MQGLQAALSSDLSRAATCSISMSGSSFSPSPRFRWFALDGRPETVAAALRYLLFALFGSVFYLLGVALIYGAYGTLDIALLSSRIRARAGRLAGGGADDRGAPGEDRAFPAASVAASGPRQRARRGERRAFGAGGQGIVLSRRPALVRRAGAASRRVFPGTILAALGSAAILFGSVLALRQARLKLLIAYSTVAQIGYLFLMFPLGHGPWAADAFSGGVMQALVARLRQGGDVPLRRPDRRVPRP